HGHEEEEDEADGVLRPRRQLLPRRRLAEVGRRLPHAPALAPRPVPFERCGFLDAAGGLAGGGLRHGGVERLGVRRKIRGGRSAGVQAIKQASLRACTRGRLRAHGGPSSRAVPARTSASSAGTPARVRPAVSTGGPTTRRATPGREAQRRSSSSPTSPSRATGTSETPASTASRNPPRRNG